MHQKSLLSPAQAAERLGIARGTVYAAISKGELQAYRIGRTRRISEEQIQKYLERHSNVVVITNLLGT